MIFNRKGAKTQRVAKNFYNLICNPVKGRLRGIELFF